MGAILAIPAGISLLVWRRQWAAAVVKQRNRVMRYQLGPKDELIHRRAAVVVGCLFVGFGLVVLAMRL